MKFVFLPLAGLVMLWVFSRARPVLSYDGPQLYEFGWDDIENEGMPTKLVVTQLN
jgi:hypothetical protein